MVKKKHHAPDYAKNKTADVINKGWTPDVPNKQWEINRALTPEGSDTSYGAFFPRSGKDRPTMHLKVNECDH
jgi:hypothetical protein